MRLQINIGGRRYNLPPFATLIQTRKEQGQTVIDIIRGVVPEETWLRLSESQTNNESGFGQ
ncbi:MAG: hypothetical protein JXA25_13170 [Anaerolineales bacterium]|nr:hypothetical protein [Anaerolineales bacterium]